MSAAGWPSERLGFAALALLTLAPVVLQGLWRPLAGALHAEADSVLLAAAALVIASAALVASAVSFGRPGRRWAPLASAGLTALPLALLLGAGPPLAAVAAALLGVAGFCGALAPWLLRRLPGALDGLAARRKGVAVAMLTLGVFTVTMTTRIAIFMGDARHPELSLEPEIPFLVEHSCLTAYVQGARLASDGVANIYDMDQWPHLRDTPQARANAVPYAPFGLDAFAYPPPFLLLPRVLLTPLGDFASQRALWFAVNALCLAAGLWIVATWLGGRAGLRALLLIPCIWIGQSTLATLQVGNVHAMVVVAAMLALVAFERRRPALGGALLAFAVISKISPGLLVVVLLIQRRFREVLWTAAWGLVFGLLGLAVFGVDPFVAFVAYELPRLSSGEALGFLTLPESVQINFAPFGVPFRLAAAGVDIADPWAAARVINQVFTVALVVMTVLAARKGGGPRAQAEVWAALLTLGSLRSPLAPGYVLISLLWLFSMRAGEVRGYRGALVAVLLWVGVSIPVSGLGVAAATAALCQQGLAIGVAGYFLLRRPPVEDDER